MTRRTLFFLLLAGAVAGAADAPTALLQWNNGEAIPGELRQVSATEATWQTPLFQSPIAIQWSALHRITQALPTSPTEEPFGFTMKDGSHLYGTLLAVSDSAIEIRSKRHGDVSLKRGEVLSVQRLQGGSLLRANPFRENLLQPGPASQSREAKPEVAPLSIGAGGAFNIPFWNQSASFKTELPDAVAIDIRLRSSLRPNFALKLTRSLGQQTLALETWDEDLVFHAKELFKAISKVPEETHYLEMRICWNLKTGLCFAYSPAGDLLAEWKTEPEDPEAAGKAAAFKKILVAGKTGTASRQQEMTGPIVLSNKGRDLSLELFHVHAWDGKPPQKCDPRQPRIELADGRILAGTVQSAAAESLTFLSSGADGAETIPVEQIESILFSPDLPTVKDSHTLVSFTDGTYLRGSISNSKEGTLALTTSFTSEPLSSNLDGLCQILLPPPGLETAPLPKDRLDELQAGTVHLHGSLVGGHDAVPRWLPIGATVPALLAKGDNPLITRAQPVQAEGESYSLVFTKSGDVLPAVIRTANAGGIEFTSPFMELAALPTPEVSAVLFGNKQSGDIEGFSNPGWRVLKGNSDLFKAKEETITLDNTTIGHPTGSLPGEIRVGMDPNSYGCVRFRFFCPSLDGTKSVNILVSCFGDQCTAAKENKAGQMEDQHQSSIPSTNPCVLRFVIEPSEITLYAGAARVGKFAVPASQSGGAGLVMEPAGMWGNSVREITLSSFTAKHAAGQVAFPPVDEEAKEQALVVPRFRKDAPPKHILLAANGDLLRGEIEASTASAFAFRIGLDSLQIPRDRVQAAIWLKPPTTDAPPPNVAKKEVDKLLDTELPSGERMNGNLNLGTVQQRLDRVVPGLKLDLSSDPWFKVREIDFAGQTVRAFLEDICKAADAHFRVGPDGTIFFEKGLKDANAPFEKIWWLKEMTLSPSGSAQEYLSAQGIDFPPETFATWDPAKRELAMFNTPENQTKLEALLNQKPETIVGVPNYWFRLVSGASLGVHVDKFEPETVTGTHPIYGKCTIPVSQVASISMTPFAPSTASQTVLGWNLSYAPEPVIPGADDSGSGPKVGMDAPPFKIPFLGEGEFDLAAQKGKVVILDFWATWCAPCVKSLPGLIEAASQFPKDRVSLIGINQGEASADVKRFIEARKWDLTVAMDGGNAVGKKYGVEAIPHTVIVGPDGKVAWVNTGYEEGVDAEAAATIKKLLGEEAPK